MASNKMDDAKSMMSESQPDCLGAVISCKNYDNDSRNAKNIRRF
jgi:hypothetical protein